LLLVFAARACAWGSDGGVFLHGEVGGYEGFEGLGEFLEAGGVGVLGVDGFDELVEEAVLETAEEGFAGRAVGAEEVVEVGGGLEEAELVGVAVEGGAGEAAGGEVVVVEDFLDGLGAVEDELVDVAAEGGWQGFEGGGALDGFGDLLAGRHGFCSFSCLLLAA